MTNMRPSAIHDHVILQELKLPVVKLHVSCVPLHEQDAIYFLVSSTQLFVCAELSCGITNVRLKKPVKGGILLHITLANKEELAMNMKVKGRPVCSY